MHSPDVNLITALPAAQPSSKLPSTLDFTSVGRPFFYAGLTEAFANTVRPVLMNPALTINLHWDGLTAELSVGDAQSGALGLETTVPLQQQHLQRFGWVLMEGRNGTEINFQNNSDLPLS